MSNATIAERPQGIPDPYDLPLAMLDPSRAELFQHNLHGAYFRRLREEDPVHFCPESEFGPYWSITKFDDIVAVETNHKVFSSFRDAVIGDQPDEFYIPMFIAQDPPRHDVERKSVQPGVAPGQLAKLEALVRERVGKILDGLPIGQELNWVELVSKELTAQMLATLFDMPLEDSHLLPQWSDAATNSPQAGVANITFEERHAKLMVALEYFTKLWHERAVQPPKFDFISLLAHNPETKGMIDDPMAYLGIIALLIVGGNDTTRNSISGGVVALNQFPEQYDKLRNDPSLVPGMVSEIIRWQTPLGHMRRTALEDIEFRGKSIRKGDKVVMWYASGNRDDDVIVNADAFIIDRTNPRHHVSFGFGIHRCMGNRVAELQLRVLWEEIMKRFERIELVGPPLRVASNLVMGYSDVPVVIHARAGAR